MLKGLSPILSSDPCFNTIYGLPLTGPMHDTLRGKTAVCKKNRQYYRTLGAFAGGNSVASRYLCPGGSLEGLPHTIRPRQSRSWIFAAGLIPKRLSLGWPRG